MGIWASENDSSCALIQNGTIECGALEKYFYRDAANPLLPVKAFEFCLRSAESSITGIDCIAICENSQKILESKNWGMSHKGGLEKAQKITPWVSPEEVKRFFGYDGSVVSLNHQISHAACSFYSSGLDEAAILIVDSAGLWTISSYGYGSSNQIYIVEDDPYPCSVGILMALVACYLGFKVKSEEYKIGLLASYGKPLYTEKISLLMRHIDNERLSIYQNCVDMEEVCKLYFGRLSEVFGFPARNATDGIKDFHRDVAASMQLVFENFFVDKARYLYDRIGLKQLCIAGDMAFNTVANNRVQKELHLKTVYVNKACDDSTCAIGAAMEQYVKQTQGKLPVNPVKHFLLGQEYSHDRILHLLRATDIEYMDYQQRQDELISYTLDMLEKGKVIGWFNGRVSFGNAYPLTRLVLCDPRGRDVCDIMCSVMKKKDGLMPVSYLTVEMERKGYPNENADLRADKEQTSYIGNVIEVNESTQPLLYKLVNKYCINTGGTMLSSAPLSLPDAGVVTHSFDALKAFITSKIDLLVLGDFIIEREKNAKPSVAWLRIQYTNS